MCFQVKVVLNRVSYDQPMFLHITDAATRPSNAFGFMFSFIVTFFFWGGGGIYCNTGVTGGVHNLVYP